MATQGIELIPKEIAAAKEQRKVTGRLWLVTIILLVISVGGSGVLYYYKQQQSSQLQSLQAQAQNQEESIAQMADIERKVLGLKNKSSAIPQILSQRSYFSKVLTAVKSSQPSSLSITGLSASVAEDTVTINGETSNYNKLADFLDNLVDPQKGGSLFTQANLTSVSFDPSSGKANFVIDTNLKEGGLKKPLPGEEGQNGS